MNFTSKPTIELLGSHFGRVGTEESRFQNIDIGINLVQRADSRAWMGAAFSSDGKYGVACVASGYLYVSSDYGETWTQAGTSQSWGGVAVSADGKYMVAVCNGYIYVSPDYGTTWNQKATSQSWYHVAVSSSGKYQTATINGGSGTIYRSSDFGETWTAVNGIPAQDWRGIAMSADGKTQLAAAAPVGSSYLYISRNYGLSWTTAESQRGWHVVAMSDDGRYMVAAVYTGAIYFSSNYGATWSTLSGAGTGGWWQLKMSSNGRVIVASHVSNPAKTWFSVDYGANWTDSGRSGQVKCLGLSSDGKLMLIGENTGYLYSSFGLASIKGSVSIEKALAYSAIQTATVGNGESPKNITPTHAAIEITNTTDIAADIEVNLVSGLLKNGTILYVHYVYTEAHSGSTLTIDGLNGMQVILSAGATASFYKNSAGYWSPIIPQIPVG